MQIKRIYIFALLGTLLSLPLHAEEEKKEEFKVPKSMVDSAERRLGKERNPERRLQLVLRWIRIKEEYERDQVIEGQDPEKAANLVNAKKKILNQLKLELAFFEKTKGLDYSQIYRELAFRHLEINKAREAIDYFRKLPRLYPSDHLAYGDALIAMKDHNAALDSYIKAAKDPELVTMSWYKRGWVYMQKQEFDKALNAFNTALKDRPNSSIQLREEAFKDRIRPYVETHKKELFVDEDNQSLLQLVKELYPSDEKKQKDAYTETLESLIHAFNAKSQVEKARSTFSFLAKAIDDPYQVLITASPLWLKVYRGRLNHSALEEIINAYPNKALSMKGTDPLRAELNNTAVFYQTLAEEDSPDKELESLKEAKRLLVFVYAKYFTLFPDDKNVDPLRINYGNILLEKGDARACLKIIKKRGGEDKEVETIAVELEGRCEFKYLDQLYNEPHSAEFYSRLHSSLLTEKLYLRAGLGVPKEQVFESLVRMLFGALKKNPASQDLRKILLALLDQYPFEKTSSLYRELLVTRAEIRFKDLSELKEKPSDIDEQFYKIYQVTPNDTEVARKSLENAILLSKGDTALKRCDEFKGSYLSAFQGKSVMFERCLKLAQRSLQLERELAYLLANELKRDAKTRLQILTIEYGLNKRGARKSVENMPGSASAAFLELWDGHDIKQKPQPPSYIRIEKRVKSFVASLKPIKFSQIGKIVPRRAKDYDRTEKRWLKFYNASPDPQWAAEALLLRARMALAMKDWMQKLPEPKGLTEEEIKTYRTQAEQVLAPWAERANQAKKECSEIAHSLSPKFKLSDKDKDVCPEETPRSRLKEYLTAWNETRQKQPKRKPWEKEDQGERIDLIEDLLKAGRDQKNVNRSKFFLIRAFDLAKSNYYKARALLGLARLTGKDSHWLGANSLDGNLAEPIEWLKDKAEGNPFFERLYNRQIKVAVR